MDSFFKCADIAGEVYKNNMPGIKHSRKKYKGIVIDDMKISNDNNPYHKKAGRYVLIDPISPIFEDDYALMDVLTKYLKLLVKNKTKRKSKLNVLIVGLGNKDYTPDSLGPKVIDKVDVNYHLKNEKIKKKNIKTYVSAFSPGVMASTGFESSNMIKAIVENEKIDVVIAIDALATRTIKRLNRVIQLTDTGIAPGSGVGNYRKALDEGFIKIPVIAIGVATVIDTAAIVLETLNNMKIDENKQGEIASNVMENIDEKIIMSTKDIDFEIKSIAKLIANSINLAFN